MLQIVNEEGQPGIVPNIMHTSIMTVISADNLKLISLHAVPPTIGTYIYLYLLDLHSSFY